LIEARLNAGGSVRTQIANFSVVSSNHRQHLHNILESKKLYNPDVVIFYGGYNEIVAPAYYDPRLGYPYNFYFRQETSPLYQVLLKYSPSFYLLDGVFSRAGIWSLTPLVNLRKAEKYYSDWWKKKIAANYFETIELAHSVTRAFESNHCGKPVFMFFYQPYRVPESFLELHNKLRAGINSYDFGYDISNAFEERGVSVFTDPVHVTQYGREIIAEEIAQNMLANEELGKCITDFK